MNTLHEWIQIPSVFEGVLLFVSIFAGIFGAILGLGGGIVIVPLLTLGLGMNIRYAIGASIVSVIATSSGAAVAFLRDHVTNIRVAMVLEVATTIGALVGVLLSPYFSAPALFFVFSCILFYSSFTLFKKRKSDQPLEKSDDWWAGKLKLHSSYPDRHLGKKVDYQVARVPLGFSLMLGAGTISGLLGVGSGVLKVPAMDSAMKIPIKVSSATSSFMIGVTAAASAGAYYMRGNILPMVAAPVAIGVLIGSGIGTRIMMKLSSQVIRKVFLAVLLIVATQMVFKAVGGFFK